MFLRSLIVVLYLFFAKTDSSLISCDLIKFATSGLSYPVYYGQCGECQTTIIDTGSIGSFYVNCTSNRIQLSTSLNCSALNTTYSIAFSPDLYSCNGCAYIRRIAIVSTPYKGVDSLLFNYTSNACLMPEYASYYFKRFNESFYSYHVASDCSDATTFFYGQIICVSNNTSLFTSARLDTTNKSNACELQTSILWFAVSLFFINF